MMKTIKVKTYSTSEWEGLSCKGFGYVCNTNKPQKKGNSNQQESLLCLLRLALGENYKLINICKMIKIVIHDFHNKTL